MSIDNLRSALQPAPFKPDRSANLKRFAGDYGLIVVFILVVLYLTLGTDSFFSGGNLVNVVRQSSIIGFVAVGMTFVMITAGIDLSVGAVVGLAGVVAASHAFGGPVYIPVVLGLLVGLAVGALNAGLITKGGILPFLATLAAMAIARGVALIYTNGQPVSGLNVSFDRIGAGAVLGVPVPVLLFIVVALIADHTLTRTRFGRHIYAVGGSPEAATRVGIPVRAVLVKIYVLAGLLAGFAGVVLAARVDGADPLAGTGYELQAIAAVVIGGTSLFGGIGTIRGTVIGVLLLGVVQNGLDLLNVSSYYRDIVQGAILVLAVLLNRWKSD